MRWVYDQEISDHNDTIEIISIDPTGRYLASASSDGALLVYQWKNDAYSLLWEIEKPETFKRVQCLSFLPHNSQLMYVTDAVHVYDVEVGELLYNLDTVPSGLAVTSDGGTAAFGYRNHQIELWDLSKRTGTEIFQGDPGPNKDKGSVVKTLAFSPKGNLLAAGANDNIINVWDLLKRKPFISSRKPSLHLLGHNVGPYEVGFDPSGARLYSTAEMDKTICWDIFSGEIIWSNHGGKCLAISNEGIIIAVGGPNPMQIFDAKTGETIETLRYIGYYVSSISFTPDNSRLLACSYDSKIHLWTNIDQMETLQDYLFRDKAWFRNLLLYFIKLGFFEESNNLSEAETLDELLLRYEKENYRKPPETPHSDLDHLRVFALDRKRVWWNDLESDVCAINKVYVKFLKDMADISIGKFKPEDIEEIWKSPEGPISLSFKVEGRKNQIEPEYYGDYLDISILQDLNRIIEGNQMSFEMYQPFDQSAYVVSVSPNQKERLMENLGWSFVDFSKRLRR